MANTSQFNVSWDSEELAGNKSDANFLRIPATKEGIKVRIMSSPSKIVAHWPDLAEGGKTKVLCPGAGCPLCAKGDKPNTRYNVYVIDRTDGAAKILDAPTSVIQKIAEFAKDPEYGDPTKYDFKLSKTGSGLETKYSALASPKRSEPTEEENQKVKDGPTIESLNPIPSIEDIKKMPLKLFMDEELALESNVSADAADDDDWSAI